MTKMMMTTMTRANSNHPVLIDCDTGIDDALALVYLAGLAAAGEVPVPSPTPKAPTIMITLGKSYLAAHKAILLKLAHSIQIVVS